MRHFSLIEKINRGSDWFSSRGVQREKSQIPKHPKNNLPL